jgi:hypothetical protein
MIRHLAIIPLLAAGIALAGCVSSSGVSTIQQTVVAACGYLPTVATIEDLINLNSPTLATATQIARAICAAVTVKGGAGGPEARGPGVGPARVDGVIIHGKFVR